MSDRVPEGKARLVIVQYGDYADAYQRFRSGGGETYYAQRYTVDYVADLVRRGQVECAHIICFSADLPRVEQAPGLFTSGVALFEPGAAPAFDRLFAAITESKPTHLVVGAPLVPLLNFGLARGWHLLPLFADSFRGSGLKQWVRNSRLAWVLNDRRIPWVANHNLAAALDLERIGVSAKKVVPFDWPALITPGDRPAKSAPPPDRTFRLIYVGQLSEAKGVGDLIRALSELRRSHDDVSLSLIGAGDSDALSGLAHALGVAEHVRFLGKRSHAEVQDAMRSHDAVVVPSRHTYPEGLPMTLYEALCSRTPIIASDHPMFALRIHHLDNALVFRAESPRDLAARVHELRTDPALYARLSHRAESAASDYLCPLKWDRLLASWLGLIANEIPDNTLANIAR